MSVIDQTLKKIQLNRQFKGVMGNLSEEATPRQRPDAASESFKQSQGSQVSQGSESLPGSLVVPRIFLFLLPLLLFSFTIFHHSLPLIPSAKPQRPGTAQVAVQGIVTMGKEKFVLINNEIYESGDAVEGMTVLNISGDSVELLKQGKIEILKTASEFTPEGLQRRAVRPFPERSKPP